MAKTLQTRLDKDHKYRNPLRIHWLPGIFTYISHKFKPNVGNGSVMGNSLAWPPSVKVSILATGRQRFQIGNWKIRETILVGHPIIIQ